MSVVSVYTKTINERIPQMENGISARVIGLDGSDITYHFAPHPGRWAEINEYYGKLIQDGIIKTAFISLTH